MAGIAKIKLVKQREDTGCGIACVSMLSSKNYDEVKVILCELMKWAPHRKTFYTKSSDILLLLKALNIQACRKKSKNWNEISPISIVGVNRKGGYFHWVLVLKDCNRFLIIDPETAEVYQGDEWANEKNNGYMHSSGSSFFIEISGAIKFIQV